MAQLSYRTAAQQDLILTSGGFASRSRLKCYGCGGEWKVTKKNGPAEANTHAAGCRRVPNRVGVAADARSAILTALGRL
jgi:hypothetical protein